MEINIMSWNTQLYEYGTKDIETGVIKRAFDEAPVEEVARFTKNYLESNDNSIVVLQEIPFKRKNEAGKWEINSHYDTIRKVFPQQEYKLICLDCDDKWHIKMTMVVSKKELLIEHPNIRKSNIFVPFIIKEKEISVLGVHAHNAFELNEWIRDNSYSPNIIVGDFNAGNYVKSERDNEIAINRANYQILSAGYIDACQGKYTTTYDEPTQIDHILIENSYKFNSRYVLKSSEVDNTIKYSDHHPINCKLIIE